MAGLGLTVFNAAAGQIAGGAVRLGSAAQRQLSDPQSFQPGVVNYFAKPVRVTTGPTGLVELCVWRLPCLR